MLVAHPHNNHGLVEFIESHCVHSALRHSKKRWNGSGEDVLLKPGLDACCNQIQTCETSAEKKETDLFKCWPLKKNGGLSP